MCVLLSYILYLPDCWLEVQYPEGPATGHLSTDCLGFPVSVYKRMLRWFPTLQVATACFSFSPPDLNFLVTYFISMYTHNDHCHRVTAQLQLINIIIIIIFTVVKEWSFFSLPTYTFTTYAHETLDVFSISITK